MTLCRAMVFAKDLDRMTAFYRDAFGLSEVPGTRQPGWVELDAGGATLAFHVIPEHIAEGIEITDPPRARSETPLQLAFAVDDLDAARTHLAALGAVVFEPWSAYACNALDPEGNVFQITTR